MSTGIYFIQARELRKYTGASVHSMYYKEPYKSFIEAQGGRYAFPIGIVPLLFGLFPEQLAEIFDFSGMLEKFGYDRDRYTQLVAKEMEKFFEPFEKRIEELFEKGEIKRIQYDSFKKRLEEMKRWLASFRGEKKK